MLHGLLALLDDIVILTRSAAASLDDVATLTARASGKAAGIVIDDAAVTPGYVVGLRPERELPVIWTIATGSLRNKLLILLPVALLLSWLLPMAITPLLIAGGVFLSFEGVEKLLHAAGKRPETAAKPVTDPATLEALRIRGAITTDFILSAEIMAITLSAVSESTTSLAMQAAVLFSVAISLTVAVYGVVALVVKADEAGLAMARSSRHPIRVAGRAVVLGMPWVMRALSVIGTAAMLWVGGGIVVHGAAELGAAGPEHAIERLAGSAGTASPVAGGLLAWLVEAVTMAVVGVAAGAIAVVARAAAVRLLEGVRRGNVRG